jgi:viroplasmin and RNaseH domain-containing protein
MGKVLSENGVYTNFSQESPKVTGVSGAVFRGNFKTKEEAQSCLSGVGSIPEVSTPSRKQKWYVISVGQDPSDKGAYNNWPKVASKVVGVSRAIYQGGLRSQPEDSLACTQMPASTPTTPSPPCVDSNPALPPPQHGPPGYP